MIKNILKLEGARKLSKSEQIQLKGGGIKGKLPVCCNPLLYCCWPIPGGCHAYSSPPKCI